MAVVVVVQSSSLLSFGLTNLVLALKLNRNLTRAAPAGAAVAIAAAAADFAAGFPAKNFIKFLLIEMLILVARLTNCSDTKDSERSSRGSYSNLKIAADNGGSCRVKLALKLSLKVSLELQADCKL